VERIIQVISGGDEGPDDGPGGDGSDSGDEGPDDNQDPDGSGEYNDEEDPDNGDGEQGNEGDYNDDDDQGDTDDNSAGPDDVGGDNGSGEVDIPDAIRDGINIDNENFHFDSSLDNHEAFKNQLLDILSSNSEIAALLGFFSNGVLDITFTVGSSDGIAHLDHSNENMFIMNFDPSNIDENGFISLDALDNAGYDHTGLSGLESLAVVIAHEAMHAKHAAVWDAALRDNSYSNEQAMNWLLGQGYSQDFVNIFTIESVNQFGDPIWIQNPDVSEDMHDYMEAHNQQYFDGVLQELQGDIQAYENYLDQLNSGGQQGGGGGGSYNWYGNY